MRFMRTALHAFENGLWGLAEDEEKAFEWYQKAADAMNTAGIAMTAYFLINGLGGGEREREREAKAKANVTYGTCQMFYAAAAGSDLACREVGIYHLYGLHDIPEDKAKAQYFLKRATDGSCTVLHMKQEDLEEAKQAIEQLQGEKTSGDVR